MQTLGSSMSYRTTETPVGLEDSKLLSYRREGDLLTVVLLAWNETRLHLVFKDVILFLDRNYGDTSALRELHDGSELLGQALSDSYDGMVPSGHPYKHYQLLNLDDLPALEVISGALEISHSK